MAAGTKTPKDFTAAAKAWLQQKVERIPADLVAYIDAAVKEYSRHRALEVAEDKAGDGTNDVALPATFVDGFSRLVSVEYPIGEIPAAMLVDDEWQIYRKPTGPVLRLSGHKPTAQQSARLLFTKYHTAGTDDPLVGSSIPDSDFQPVCALSASYAALALANTYNQSVDPNSDAAFVDGEDRRAAITSAAKELRTIFHDHMGIKGGEGAAPKAIAQGWVDLDSPGPGFGAPLTHSRRYT